MIEGKLFQKFGGFSSLHLRDTISGDPGSSSQGEEEPSGNQEPSDTPQTTGDINGPIGITGEDLDDSNGGRSVYGIDY